MSTRCSSRSPLIPITEKEPEMKAVAVAIVAAITVAIALIPVVVIITRALDAVRGMLG